MVIGPIFVLRKNLLIRVGSRGDSFAFSRSPSWAWDRDKTPLSLALAWDGLEFL